MLPKKYRLLAKEFRTLYSRGTKYRGKYGMLIAFPSTLSPRFGFVVSKKIGNAVQRHRMTRLLRVVCLELSKEVNLKGFDFEYIAFEFCNSKEELKGALLDQFRRIVK